MSLLDALLLESSRINVWIAARSDGIGGAGTIADPFDGSSATKFDALMNDTTKVPANSRVHLGPGTFETRGYCDNVAGGWQARAGIKIVGSGIDVTTLKLVGCATADEQYFAVGHALGSGGSSVDAFEISELTVDCNLAGQSVNVAAGAIRIKGTHSRIRRIKAINWGTRSTVEGCYVISSIIRDPGSSNPSIANTVIEECTAIEPAGETLGPVTVLYAGGTADNSVRLEFPGEAAVIRNCFVDAGESVPLTTDVRAISVAWYHGAVVEGNQVRNVRSGGPFQDGAPVGEAIVRNNFYRNVVTGPGHLASLSDSVALTDIGFGAVIGVGVDAAGFMNLAPPLRVGDAVEVQSNQSALNGVFPVTEVQNSPEQYFLYTLQAPSGAVATTGSFKKVWGAQKILIEGNVIELAPFTESDPLVPVGIQLDTQVTPSLPGIIYGQVIVRNNRFRYADGASGDFTGYAIHVNGGENVIITDNVIETVPSDGDAIRTENCLNVSIFDNRTPAGPLLDTATDTYFSELEVPSEDVLMSACFEK